MTSFRNNWHVSPDGNVNHTGSRFDPVPLAWILRGDNVRPGNTITILPGEYVGDYVAKVIGTAESPIVVTFGDARIKGSFQIALTC